MTAFSTLTVLPAAQLANLNELGYLSMTSVQAAALPAILAGKDVRVQAQTGSGKTAAFGLGLLQHIDPSWPIRSPASCAAWRAACRTSRF